MSDDEKLEQIEANSNELKFQSGEGTFFEQVFNEGYKGNPDSQDGLDWKEQAGFIYFDEKTYTIGFIASPDTYNAHIFTVRTNKLHGDDGKYLDMGQTMKIIAGYHTHQYADIETKYFKLGSHGYDVSQASKGIMPQFIIDSQKVFSYSLEHGNLSMKNLGLTGNFFKGQQSILREAFIQNTIRKK